MPFNAILAQENLKEKFNIKYLLFIKNYSQVQFSRAYYQNQKENISLKQPTAENIPIISKLIKGKEAVRDKEPRERADTREKDKIDEQQY